MLRKKKKSGAGAVHLIFVLGLIAFTAAVVVPRFTNRTVLKQQKEIQVEASAILKDAKDYIKSSDLAALGIESTNLTKEVFDSIKVVNAVDYLQAQGYLKGVSSVKLIVNNKDINLGNLGVITNVPTKDIVVDQSGALAKAPYIREQ